MAASEQRSKPVMEANNGRVDIIGDVFYKVKKSQRREVGDDKSLTYIEGNSPILDCADKPKSFLRRLL